MAPSQRFDYFGTLKITLNNRDLTDCSKIIFYNIQRKIFDINADLTLKNG